MNDRHVAPAQVAEIGKVNALKPREADFIGKKGYRRYYRKDGTYSWRYRYNPQFATKEGAEMKERIMPFVRADAERMYRAKGSRAPEVALRDATGGVRFVDPALAESTARQNGWSHHWRAGGSRVERGIDGMLFREGRGEWEPLGVRCLGTPLVREPRLRSPQRDPEGVEWVRRGRKWVRG